MKNILNLRGRSPLRAELAGMQISRGQGRHMDRVIDCFDLIFVREGILPIQEEEQAFQVKAGQTLLLWPDRHHWGTADMSPDMRMYWLHFKLNGQYEPPSDSATATLLSVPQYATVGRPEVLESLLRRYIDDLATGRLLPDYADTLAWLILAEVSDQRPVGTTNRTGAAVAGRALSYIRSHLNVPLTVAQIAEELGYNPEYLNRVFHQVYSHTLTQEIHHSRIGYARFLLLYSNKSIKEIAHECGFADVNYFSRLFRRYEGISAMAFRRVNAQVEVNYE